LPSSPLTLKYIAYFTQSRWSPWSQWITPRVKLLFICPLMTLCFLVTLVYNSRMTFSTWTWTFLSYLNPFFETLGLGMSLIWEDCMSFFVKFSTSTPYVVKSLLSTYQVTLRAMLFNLQQASWWVFLQICKTNAIRQTQMWKPLPSLNFLLKIYTM